jgi:hypothetical protein
VDPRADLDGLKKRKYLTLPGLEFVHPVASRCTDYATSANTIMNTIIKFLAPIEARNILIELLLTFQEGNLLYVILKFSYECK